MLVNTNSAEVALDSSASTSAILLETSVDKLEAKEVSAEDLVDSSVEILVSNDASADALVEIVAANEASPEILADSSEETSASK